MARRPRIEYAGALYHVIARGNRKETVFLNNADYEDYLSRLSLYKKRFSFVIHAYCLMPNHVHLLIETGEVPLSRIMHCLQFSYTQSFNKRNKKVGHAFQGRYKAILCNKDSYLLELVRYIHLNPIRAGMVKLPEKYQWSSHCGYLGAKECQNIVDAKLVLDIFGRTRTNAILAYRRFIFEGIGDGHKEEFYQVKDQRILGDEKFAENVVGQHDGLREGYWDLGLKEIVDAACNVFDVSPSRLSSVSRERCAAMVRGVVALLAKKLCGMTLADIGRDFNRKDRDMSHVLCMAEEKARTDPRFADSVKIVEKRLIHDRRPVLVRERKDRNRARVNAKNM